MLYRVLGKAKEARIPFCAHLDLTYRCHQRCLHCYLPEAWRRGQSPGPELTTVQVKRTLDQLAEASSFLLTLSGGEVFLRPDLLPILEYARAQNFSISLMTTGTLGVNRDTLRFLRELGLNGLLLTLFSLNPAVHDGLTGIPGSWALLQDTIREARAAGLPVVFNCVAMQPNVGDVQAIRDFAQQEGIALRLDARLTRRWDGSPHRPGLALTPEEQENLYKDVGLKSDEHRERATTGWDPDIHGCGAGEYLGYITPSGDLWPCIEIPVSCGKLLERSSFRDLWETSPRLQEVREVQERLAVGQRLCDPSIRDMLLNINLTKCQEGGK
jgi:MoaA/NifB/PqqE/SkfB family radical SAM enzyme